MTELAKVEEGNEMGSVLSTVDVAEKRRRMDEVARRRRELDTEIQQANWSTDLAE